MEKDITIYDIAREAGVSPATVSRVITKNARVSEAKRQKVEALIAKYNFSPNALARGLSDTRSNTIGLLVADIRNPYYAEMAVEIELAAQRHGYSVLLCNALNQPALEDQMLESLYGHRVDAIVQAGCRVDDLHSDPQYVEHVNRIAKTIPFIASGHLDDGDCYIISTDHAESMRMVFSYLHGLGHTKIAMLGGKLHVKSTYDKWMQYMYLMGQLGLPVREEYLQSGSYNAESGYHCMKRLMALDDPPTAVIAINDYAAVGTLRAIEEQGLSVPGDFSVISHDNTFLSRMGSVQLTSVDYDYPMYAEKIVDAIMKLVAGESVPRKQLLVPTIVHRDSCAAPSNKAT